MHLVQLLLPTYDNDGQPISAAEHRRVREELTERFGGLTAYSRAPAEGLWEDAGDGRRRRDDIVVYEVMTEAIDERWWASYRVSLERRFRQDEIVIRTLAVRRL